MWRTDDYVYSESIFYLLFDFHALKQTRLRFVGVFVCTICEHVSSLLHCSWAAAWFAPHATPPVSNGLPPFLNTRTSLLLNEKLLAPTRVTFPNFTTNIYSLFALGIIRSCA